MYGENTAAFRSIFGRNTAVQFGKDVSANGQSEGVFFVKLHESNLEGYKTQVEIIFTNSEGVELRRETNFLGPATSIKK